jgi:hypothetical protein
MKYFFKEREGETAKQKEEGKNQQSRRNRKAFRS